MLTQTSKNASRRHVHERIRKKILGTAERPRLNVYRSLSHIYVQLIDDLKGQTLVSAHSAEGKKGDRRTGGIHLDDAGCPRRGVCGHRDHLRDAGSEPDREVASRRPRGARRDSGRGSALWSEARKLSRPLTE